VNDREWIGGARVAWAARLFVAAFAFNAFSVRTADPDFWGHLAIGRLMFETGSVPRHDVFSYLPTRDWLNYEWLANLVQYPIHQQLGEPGIVLLKTWVGMLTMMAVYFAARRRAGSDFTTVLLLIPAIATVALGFPPRAQIFTYCLFACWLYALERARAGEWRWLWPLPVTMMLWANLHAGFLAGLGMPVLYAIGQALQRKPWKPFAATFLVAGALTLVNPYGFKFWLILLEGTTIQRPHITEWVPVPLDFTTFPFFKLLCAITLLAIITTRVRDELAALLVLIVTCALGWKVQRHLPFFAIASALYVPGWLATLIARRRADRPPPPPALGNSLAGLLAIGALMVFINGLAPDGKFSFALDRKVYQFPTKAVAFMQREGLRGNLATEFRWGLFCAWKLYPQCKLAVDGRYETVFDHTVIAEDLAFFYGESPERFLSKYPTDFVLTDSPPLRKWLEAQPKVKLIYSDTEAWLYRIEPPT